MSDRDTVERMLRQMQQRNGCFELTVALVVGAVVGTLSL